jgi:hypothetical protein
LPSRNNSVIVLDVQETMEGAARGVAPQFVPEFRNWARQRNQRISDQPTCDRPYQLKLTGNIEVRSQTQNNRPVAFVTGLIELIDMESKQVLFSYRPGVHRRGEPGMAEAAIALSAQREAAADALLEIASRITAFLPAPDDVVLRGQ